VQAVFGSLAQAVGSGNKVRALAQGGKTRTPALPAVPTFIESGLDDFTVITSYGLAAPAGRRAQLSIVFAARWSRPSMIRRSGKDRQSRQ